MTIVLVAVCTALTFLCINLYFKLAGLQKDSDGYSKAILELCQDQVKLKKENDDLYRKFVCMTNNVSEPKMQEYANTAVSDALDGVDFDLERYDNAIKAMWQAIGTQKKRLDKIDPVKREPIDPAENLKHQSELMDKMLKQSTDIYAEKLSKKNAEKVSTDNKSSVYVTTRITPEDIKDTLYSKLDSQTPIVGIDLAPKAAIITPARGAGKDLYSKYMEKLNDVKDNFPATKEPDTTAFPSDPEIEQYATTQIPTFANNSVEDLDETMDISEFFTRVKNN